MVTNVSGKSNAGKNGRSKIMDSINIIKISFEYLWEVNLFNNAFILIINNQETRNKYSKQISNSKYQNPKIFGI